MKEILRHFLMQIGCKDPSLMLYGIKHFNLKLFFDGIFLYSEYFVVAIQRNTGKFAKKYESYLQNDKFRDNLIRGLDKKSVDTVKKIERNLKIILRLEKNTCFKKSDFGIDEYNEYQLDKYIREYTKNIYLPINQKEYTVFYFKHGINEVENLERVDGKDILDCGAFIGDSAMMFEKELRITDKGGHIYCIEPSKENRKLLEKTIIRNNKKGKIIPIPLGVGTKKEKSYINFDGSASYVSKECIDNNEIVVDTIDNIVDNYNINPGLIKRDVEGFEYDSIIGAEKTIRKYKPILLISIYHSGKDFYEIKPLLELWDLGYHFKIRHLSNHPYFETMLICY